MRAFSLRSHHDCHRSARSIRFSSAYASASEQMLSVSAPFFSASSCFTNFAVLPEVFMPDKYSRVSGRLIFCCLNRYFEQNLQYRVQIFWLSRRIACQHLLDGAPDHKGVIGRSQNSYLHCEIFGVPLQAPPRLTNQKARWRWLDHQQHPLLA